MASKQAMPSPHLHGSSRDVQVVRDFVAGQHPAVSESRVPGAESVAVSDVFDDAALERLTRARHVAACVQYRRNVSVSLANIASGAKIR